MGKGGSDSKERERSVMIRAERHNGERGEGKGSRKKERRRMCVRNLRRKRIIKRKGKEWKNEAASVRGRGRILGREPESGNEE